MDVLISGDFVGKDLESLTVKANLIIIHIYFPAGGLLTEGIVMLGETERSHFKLPLPPPPDARVCRWTDVLPSKTMTHNTTAFTAKIRNVSGIPGVHVWFLYGLETVGKS